MNYFKALGILFGLIALLKPIYMHVLPWNEFDFIKKAYQEERPRWVVYACVLGLLLVALTWYMHFTVNVKYSIVITLLFSLTLVKGITLLFNYQAFQQWVTKLLQKENNKKIVLIDMGASLFGLVLIVCSFVFY